MKKAMYKLITGALLIVISVVPIMAGCTGGGKVVTVGNKNFTEQYIVGQLIKQVLEENGYTVNLVSDISTNALREGMEAGDIDICADYTGTAWMTHLAHEYEPGVDNNDIYEMVRSEELEENGFIWLDPMWNNNTYALACWPDFAADNDITTLSDLAALYNAGGVDFEMFLDFEFSTRPDGLPGLEAHYDFEVPDDNLSTAAPGASLLALENQETDISMVFGTDPIIAEHSWHIFQDDQAFFPPYDLTPYISANVYAKYPEIAGILNKLVATFPGGGEDATPAIVAQGQAAWQELNAKVDLDLMEPDEAAAEYLEEHGLVQ